MNLNKKANMTNQHKKKYDAIKKASAFTIMLIQPIKIK